MVTGGSGIVTFPSASARARSAPLRHAIWLVILPSGPRRAISPERLPRMRHPLVRGARLSPGTPPGLAQPYGCRTPRPARDCGSRGAHAAPRRAGGRIAMPHHGPDVKFGYFLVPDVSATLGATAQEVERLRLGYVRVQGWWRAGLTAGRRRSPSPREVCRRP